MSNLWKLQQLQCDLHRLVLERHHQQGMAGRHIAIPTWLESLDMSQYLPDFQKYGGVEDILQLTESDINDLGVRNAAHRAKIFSSLTILRDKYERSTTPGRKPSPLQQVQRSQSATAQLSWSPPSAVNSPDYQQVSTNISPERLQHDLLIELHGDPADLKSFAWYHGSISRQRAERIVVKNGDFLVRDCISQPGNFVLSCCWRGGPFHFVINSSVVDQGPGRLPKVNYYFEEVCFTSVQSLVQYYQDECKVITDISGAVITTPIARSMPLSFYDSRYGMLSAMANAQGSHYSNLPRTRNSPTPGQYQSPSSAWPPTTLVAPQAGYPPGSVSSHYASLPGRSITPPSSLVTSGSMYMSVPAQTMMAPHPAVSTQMSPVGPQASIPPHTQNLPIRSNTPSQEQYRSPNMTPRSSPQGTPGVSPRISPSGSPQHGRKTRHVERAGSQPMLSINDIPVLLPMHMDRADSLPVIPGLYRPERDTSMPFPPADSGIYKEVTPTSNAHAITLPPSSDQHPHYIHQRSGSAPVLTPGINVTQHFDMLAPPTSLNPAISDSDLHKAPPPKPSRIPSVKYKKKPLVTVRNKALYDDDDRDYSDYSQVKSDPSWAHELPSKENKSANKNQGDKLYDNNFHGVSQSQSTLQPKDVNQNVPKGDSRKISDTNFNVLDGHDYSDIPAFPLEIDLKRGQSGMVKHPQEIFSKKQEQDEPKVKIPTIESEPSFNMNSYTSVLLPNENKLLEPSVLIKLRDTLLKTNTKLLAKYLTAVDLDLLKVINEDDLGVKVMSGLELITLPQGKQLRQEMLERIFCLQAFVKLMILTCQRVIDRAAMLSTWIQVAMETLGILGNLFAFENIMEALMSKQIQRLKDTWLVLRQAHTSSAFLFDTKLRGALRTIQEGSGSLPVQDICIPNINAIVQLLERTLDSQSYLPWEVADINNSLDTMLMHLDLARVITAQSGVYRITGRARVKDLDAERDSLEMFETLFFMRFLWGFKGAGVNRNERHNKFTMLLTAYSEKMEKEGDDGTAV
ncbi:breast cancer anti-estrogen resistance protein 3 homolog isoform X1 [Mya arenaria]|uniref:breast cancer anti-estrogen resistance protein 3 homolog isoform X1 n=1 Tax=Mya arenaria TaxID=6604 RepID=UPI0022E94E35|nr:breast cancer anti-estrogen resistance protein 3 homolog isoform X1 [Mya arenaria]